MRKVRYYLKKAIGKGKEKRSLIYLVFKYNGNRFVYSTKQTIHPDDWSERFQNIKVKSATTRDGKYKLNEYLKTLAEVCEDAYNTEIKGGIPQPRTLKGYLDKFLRQHDKDNSKPTFFDLLSDYKKGLILTRGEEKTANTLKSYETLYGHLKVFEKENNYAIDYDTINLSFFNKYVLYFKNSHYDYDKKKKMRVFKPGLSQNSIAKDIQYLKAVLKKAVSLGHSNNKWFAHEDFTVQSTDTDSVYLSNSEIMKLYDIKMTSSKLEEVKDLFVFGCFTGLRFSDYSTVKPENIVKIDGDLFIKLFTQKTGELVIIPCNPIILKIFEKYSHNPNKLPKSISNQKFNDYIKDACKIAGLDEKGRLVSEPEKELWECVSSHTARRSAATNLYLEGFPVIDIMKITGHSTEKSFLKYIRVSKLDAAKRLQTHIKTMWSQKLLKVAS